ncbi:hypothetical protein L6R29_19515 [Myxococcota bacterium]|nr:hypothetical protein [Myxococcota bacterium]
MPFPIIGIILAAVATVAVTVLLIVYWNDIVDWFRSRNDIKVEDRDNIAFTLQEKLANGNYKTVQGIFNTRTNTLKDGRAIESKQVDEELHQLHKEEELVVYE